MINASELPHEPLDVRHNNFGFIPHIGIHQRGYLFYQESSYSHFWFLGIMLIAAITVGSLPWSTEAAFGLKLKYWIAGGLIWGGICGALPYWVRNAFGQTVIIDPKSRTLTIKRQMIVIDPRRRILKFRLRKSVQIITWTDVLGLQVCYQEVPGDSKRNGYQLNLIWRGSQGQIQRQCLLKHAIKKFVASLGNDYVSLFRFELIDFTKDSQQTAAVRAMS